MRMKATSEDQADHKRRALANAKTREKRVAEVAATEYVEDKSSKPKQRKMTIAGEVTKMLSPTKKQQATIAGQNAIKSSQASSITDVRA